MTALIITNNQRTWVHGIRAVEGRGDAIWMNVVEGRWLHCVEFRLGDSRVLLGKTAEDVDAMLQESL